jgi:hypothetical protein
MGNILESNSNPNEGDASETVIDGKGYIFFKVMYI